jgi:hypothetical protein
MASGQKIHSRAHLAVKSMRMHVAINYRSIGVVERLKFYFPRGKGASFPYYSIRFKIQDILGL